MLSLATNRTDFSYLVINISSMSSVCVCMHFTCALICDTMYIKNCKILNTADQDVCNAGRAKKTGGRLCPMFRIN